MRNGHTFPVLEPNHETHPFVHHRTFLPWHPLLCPPRAEKCNPCLRYVLLPMSQAGQKLMRSPEGNSLGRSFTPFRISAGGSNAAKTPQLTNPLSYLYNSWHWRKSCEVRLSRCCFQCLFCRYLHRELRLRRRLTSPTPWSTTTKYSGDTNRNFSNFFLRTIIRC